MTKRERAYKLIRAIAHLNGFEKQMNKINFIWEGGDKNQDNCPMKACDYIFEELLCIMDIDISTRTSDNLGNIVFTLVIDEDFDDTFNEIWEEFGNDR